MPRSSQRNSAKASAAKAAKAKPKGKQLTAEQLYEQAQIALQYDDYDSARDSLRKAVRQEPENIEISEAYGSLLAEMGDEDQAISVLKRVVELSPDAGHEKYMYLGQLLEGDEALVMTRKGIDLLQSVLDQAVTDMEEGGKGRTDNTDPVEEDPALDSVEREGEEAEEADGDEEPTVEELRMGLCGALCCLAERVMGQAESLEPGSDVCVEVESLLARAAATCSSSPEPGQALASLRYEQGMPEEALKLLRESMKLWFTDEVEDERGAMIADEEGDEASGAGGTNPSYEFRFECAKLLLELDDQTDTAIAVLEDLIEEDDSNPHAWHVLGTAYYAGGMLEEALEVHDKGLALLKKLKAPSDEEIYGDFSDLKDAVEQAAKQSDGG